MEKERDLEKFNLLVQLFNQKQKIEAQIKELIADRQAVTVPNEPKKSHRQARQTSQEKFAQLKAFINKNVGQVMSITDIAKKLNHTHGEVRNRLIYLGQDGVVTRMRKGVYRFDTLTSAELMVAVSEKKEKPIVTVEHTFTPNGEGNSDLEHRVIQMLTTTGKPMRQLDLQERLDVRFGTLTPIMQKLVKNGILGERQITIVGSDKRRLTRSVFFRPEENRPA